MRPQSPRTRPNMGRRENRASATTQRPMSGYVTKRDGKSPGYTWFFGPPELAEPLRPAHHRVYCR